MLYNYVIIQKYNVLGELSFSFSVKIAQLLNDMLKKEY